MKKQLTTIIISTAAILILTAISANAQSRKKMTVNIPFEFIIAGETFNKGEYTVGRLNPQKPAMLILKSKNDAEKKIFLTQNVRSKTMVEEARLVFSKFGDSYLLREIWTGSTKSGRQLLKSKDVQESEQITRAEREKVALPASHL